MKRISIIAIGAVMLLAPALWAQQVAVQEYVLQNGLRFLMIPKKGDPNVAAGWVARVGSVNERPGITGLSHLFEHMMFKGTHVIGTTDIKKDLELMARMDGVKAEIRKEEQEQIRRLRLGQIDNLQDPKNRTDRHNQLLQELAAIEKESKALIVQSELDKIYTNAGASGLNAETSNDYTVYFINVPSNKLELWFWMESDRLMNPVFREFYSERDVVHEERRLTTDSTPTGKFEEEFNAMFWTSSPYSWPVVGWPSDLDGLTRQEALDYFALNYAPNNITACIVGDFDPAQAKALADRYFGRLKRNPQNQPPVRTREVEQLAEKRMVAYAETNPEVQIRYHSVADGHVDEPALVVLGSLLSGRTGRLYKSLVLDQQIANSVAADQEGLKWAGYFTLSGVAKPGSTPEAVEQALYKELEKLQKEKVDERELQKIKNQFAAFNFRRLDSKFLLMLQILLADSNRGWQSFNEDPKKIAAVTAEDVQRVANKYFKPENRAVALYYTKKSEGAEEDPVLAGLSDQDKAQVRQFKAAVAQMSVDEAKAILQKVEPQISAAPPEKQPLIKAILKLLQEKIQKNGGK
ncbi:MAG TPA: pitrilysin family protein [Acidobacteriota bacterium]|nr:pitrilysin family protein [Acidobacteriota bacterium]